MSSRVFLRIVAPQRSKVLYCVEALTSIAGEVIARKEYLQISIGGQAIIRFYNAATDEEKLTAAVSLCEILWQSVEV